MENFKHLLNLNRQKEDLVAKFAGVIRPSNEVEKALVEKFKHIVINLGDVDGAIGMIDSFKRGTKRLPTDKYGLNDSREVDIESAHGWYTSLGKNLERAHFRWDHGVRYTLSSESLNKVEAFLNRFMK